jgi:alcohol dehydrogenase class IV
MNPFDFYLPVEIIFGTFSVRKVGEIGRRFGFKAMIITGRKSAKESGALDLVLESLEKAGIKDLLVFDRVEPNPTDKQVNEASQIVVKEKVDFIIGLGGGSSLDVAKAVSIVSSNEGYAWDYVNYPEGPRLIPFLNRPVICIPTTAGTGSEVNRYSVISNPIRKEKLVISHSLNYPKVALIDPVLTKTMPPYLTAITGIDAFIHALESFTNKAYNPMADELAIRAVRIIKEWLPIALKDPENIKAREMMSYASMLAGISIDKKRVALIHAMEHPLSAHYPNIAHGEGLAALAVAVTEFNYKGNSEKYELFAEAMGYERKASKAVNAVLDLLESVNLTPSLRSLGAKKESIEKLTEDVCMLSWHSFKINPVEPTPEDIYRLYEAAYG